MIYEGAVIRRMVTPDHPRDSTLDDRQAAVQCRVEYVKDDATAPADGSWTCDIGAAHIYPRHLDADRRAKEIGGCFARVMTREANEDLLRDGAGAARQAHNLEVVGSIPTPAITLPATEGSPSTRVVERLPKAGHGEDAGAAVIQSTSAHKSRAVAGRTLSKRARMAKLRSSHRRVTADENPGTRWWEQGQYA